MLIPRLIFASSAAGVIMSDSDSASCMVNWQQSSAHSGAGAAGPVHF